MKQQPTLFDLAPDRESQAVQLTRFCTEHKIWVLNSKGAEEPWLAMAWSVAAERTGKACDGAARSRRTSNSHRQPDP